MHNAHLHCIVIMDWLEQGCSSLREVNVDDDHALDKIQFSSVNSSSFHQMINQRNFPR